MFSQEQIEQLEAHLSRAHVSTRQQSGRNLSYIEGWFAIKEANRIFGFDQWNRETIDIRLLAEKPRQIGRDERAKDGWGVSYFAKVRVTVGTVVREGCGTGHGIDVDLGLAHESALKEAETDAMKRALMTFGNPFGLALYDKTQADVSDDRDDTPPPKRPNASQAKKAGSWEAFAAALQVATNLNAVVKAYKDHAETLPTTWEQQISDALQYVFIADMDLFKPEETKDWLIGNDQRLQSIPEPTAILIADEAKRRIAAHRVRMAT
jgi:DNA repair and recombination protein RAD52